jgi:hypothetical protein
MGWEFDRHHLPRWRPEPPFLPGRIANPSRPQAPGAVYPSSNSPKREPSEEKYKELLAVLAVGRLRSRHWSGARSCSASTWQRFARQPPPLSRMSARTAPGSGASCSSSASSDPRPTDGGAAATSTADGPQPPTDRNPAAVRCMARSFERERPHPYHGSPSWACRCRRADEAPPTRFARSRPPSHASTPNRSSVTSADGPSRPRRSATSWPPAGPLPGPLPRPGRDRAAQRRAAGGCAAAGSSPSWAGSRSSRSATRLAGSAAASRPNRRAWPACAWSRCATGSGSRSPASWPVASAPRTWSSPDPAAATASPAAPEPRYPPPPAAGLQGRRGGGRGGAGPLGPARSS